jgi:hypothetical protein
MLFDASLLSRGIEATYQSLVPITIAASAWHFCEFTTPESENLSKTFLVEETGHQVESAQNHMYGSLRAARSWYTLVL